MRLQAVLFFAGIIAVCSSALGQKIDLARDRIPVTDLAGPWRFHTGDDPAWASPSFDDSQWGLLRADSGWKEQGYKGYSGVAWYRLEIEIPAGSGPLAIYVPNVDDSLQVYANGRLIGQHGGLPPLQRRVTSNPMVALISDEDMAAGKLLLAVRTWNDQASARVLPGGLHPAPLIGSPQRIEIWRELQSRKLYWENSYTVIVLFTNLIAGLASLGLFALRRKEREYFWFGISLLAWSAFDAITLCQIFQPVGFYASWIASWITFSLGLIAGYTFYFVFFRQKRGWLWWIPTLAGVATGGFGMGGYPVALPGSFAAFFFALTVSSICVLAVVVRAIKAGVKDAAVMLLPPVWGTALSVFCLGSYVLGHSEMVGAINRLGFQWPFPCSLPSLLGDLSNILVLIVLIRRYARIRQEEERLESELEAARIVQKILIPDEVPIIPGFAIEAVYKPAGQVGGDFHQVLSAPNGGLLAVIGDVSGKGMPAAMTVSLLVGTVRTLAHYTQDPAEILTAMNQRMMGRTSGFTTALVLRLDPDGTLIAANAGHLSPYADGKELEIFNGLPLGITASAVYSNSALRLAHGATLTLISDGIVEAQNAKGELFGFERTAAASTESAENVAHAAQAFGQQDDITVLSLALVAGD